MTTLIEERKMMTSEEMIKMAGLNWKVRQAPVLFDGNGLTEFLDKRVNYRDDNGCPLGIVSSSYKIAQNSTVFACMDSFLGNEIESYVRAGCWKGGAKVYIRAKLPGNIIFAGNDNDQGVKYIDFYTSHDGSIAMEASIVAFRLICSNGLKAWKSIAKTSIRHTLNMSLDGIKKSLGILNSQFDIIQELSEKMAQTPFEKRHIPGVLESVGLVPKEEKRSTRAQNIIEEISALFDWKAKGANLPTSQKTAW